ncbi:formate--tetrahydrofolate ligase [Corallococcus praedator]|uniref:Formate--tetrahydrofolate ligase n=1 Tax=Corallococcus praedator TaxID=2316724 RepID=A0ABX9QDC4_9BACT|nr:MULTISPECIES: formate--tetrahydrofolate ligase [Corallococcus]RKH27359.1 formate--tetrahydrofolate ligase [Corallococcus sp. CA031C]RKI02342.1 formate--tetrahydrofolate ligase [Corallococcus praedator]
MTLRPIAEVGAELGLAPEDVLPWGRDRAKVSLDALGRRSRQGRMVLVSAINPTPPGEGKTTMSVALAMGLRQRGRKAVAALREPSLGPVFGVKGGGTGGGVASLEPAADINLHFTGDLHAITSAHNLLSALVDNAVYYGHPVVLEGTKVRWRRAMDMNDRFLRNVIVGLGGKAHGVPRETSFDITAASEVMAILALSENLHDLEARLGRIVVGQAPDGSPVRAKDVNAAASMVALLKDALMPNLAQTREGGPAIVHAGPFGNIAHGCSSVVGTRLALSYADEVVTEAGFGFDLGAEKFLDIKCRGAGIWPRGVMLVVTLRALKHHGGASAAQVAEPDREALLKGFNHLEKHLESVAAFGLPAVLCVNRFPQDTAEELDELRAFAKARNVGIAVCDGFTKGGEGSLELADTVLAMLDATDAAPPKPRFLYELDQSPEEKIRAIARTVYGADDVAFTPGARKDLETARALGGAGLPVCMAKTHLSLSDDPTKTGRPRGFTLTVREVRLSAGAGFLVALTGELLTMPGLPREPAARRVTVHPDGRITGLMQGE